MATANKAQKYVKFTLYFVVVILLNIAGISFFFRTDLTKNNLYSLSDASREVVSNLREPLTIKVFFTKKLPAPHNNTEQYIRDLLNEYDLYANQYFNYQFYNVSSEEGGKDEEAERNQKLAGEYGISAVNLQIIEKDEVKFKKAYMGMVLINGDLVEQIPTITDTERLEYQITTAIRKLNNKISALLKLKEKINAKLYFSSSLKNVASHMNLENMDTLPDEIEKIVEDLNTKHFGKLAFEYIDPSVTPIRDTDLAKYHLLSLKWPEMDDGAIPPGQGSVGLVLEHNGKAVSIPIIEAIRLPLVGTQYSITDLDELDDVISQNIESLVDINEDIGYLSSHGTLSEGPPAFMNQGQANNPDQITNFKQLVSQNYTFKEVDLKAEDTMPDSFNCLIIANPSEEFSDYELYQIDQYLMRGNNLAVFLDAFKVIQPNTQQPMMNQGPVFLPQKTGFEKLLAHYGITYEAAYVLDKTCWKQRINPRFGGGERPVYFAPIIENQTIAHDLDFMKSTKGLIVMRISPLAVKSDVLEKHNIVAHKLFSSSKEAWEMKGRIQLNPMMIHPPIAEEDYRQYPLAYLLEGRFESYFKGKSLPEKKTDVEEKDEKEDNPTPEATNTSQEIKQEGAFIENGKPGKILLIASSEILKDNMVDEAGQTPNALFLLNALDELNGRSDTAVLRGKEQRLNPLEEVSSKLKTGIKFFNILGLPVLVVLFGLGIWFRRHGRKKQIQMMFMK